MKFGVYNTDLHVLFSNKEYSLFLHLLLPNTMEKDKFIEDR